VKVLFDQNLSVKLCSKLSDLFPGSSRTGLLGVNRADDRAVWNAAREGDFISMTRDSDLAEMAALFGPPPKVIWLRCGNHPTTFIADLIRRHAAAIDAFARNEPMACLEIR
jgi:predicted nuclease of predicted toxin-antitoxin system